MEMAAREARAKEVGGRLHRPHRPQGTNPPDGTTTARAPGQAPHVGHVTEMCMVLSLISFDNRRHVGAKSAGNQHHGVSLPLVLPWETRWW